MDSPFIQRFSNQPLVKNVEKKLPVQPAAPTTAGSNGKGYNPFLSALKTDTAEFNEMYGVNRPLPKPMFLGYKNDKALYGGSRLFILY